MGFIILILIIILLLLIYITYLNLRILSDNKYFLTYKNDLLDEITKNANLRAELDFYLNKNISASKQIEKITKLIKENKYLASDILEKIKEILQISEIGNISK